MQCNTNKRWCNHQDQGPKTRGFKPQAEANSSSKGLVEHASETGEPQQDSSPNLPKPCAVKVPNVAFWRPKETERWCNSTTNKRWCNHQDQGPKNARTEASSGTNSSSKGSVGHASETRKPLAHSFGALPLKRRGRRIYLKFHMQMLLWSWCAAFGAFCHCMFTWQLCSWDDRLCVPDWSTKRSQGGVWGEGISVPPFHFSSIPYKSNICSKCSDSSLHFRTDEVDECERMIENLTDQNKKLLDEGFLLSLHVLTIFLTLILFDVPQHSNCKKWN